MGGLTGPSVLCSALAVGLSRPLPLEMLVEFVRSANETVWALVAAAVIGDKNQCLTLRRDMDDLMPAAVRC